MVTARTVIAVAVLIAATAANAADPDAVVRGKAVFDAAGCKGCHTDVAGKGPALAGGRRLATPFGVFFSPNITADPDHGIGRWSDADFARALREGVAPDGGHYFPVFPYTAYAGMTDGDVRDLKAYLFSLPPVARPNRPHEVGPPFGWRFLVAGWKWLYFDGPPVAADPARDAQWNRGAYLVHVLGHCGECHTPRNPVGALRPALALAGTRQGPDGGAIPNITPDRATGIGTWADAELRALFSIGMLPDGDFVGGGMGEVVDNTTSRWSAADRDAVIAYLRSVPPIHNRIARENKKPADDEW